MLGSSAQVRELSGKARNAAALRENGQSIELLGEVDFARMLAL